MAIRSCSGIPYTSLAFEIVGALRDELRLLMLKEDEAGREHLRYLAVTQAFATTSLSRRKLAAARRAVRGSLGDYAARLKLGSFLLDSLLVPDVSGDWFEVRLVNRAWNVALSEAGRECMKRMEAAAELRRPRWGPMVCPPIPWRIE